MSFAAAMVMAEARRRRDERGRYMEGGEMAENRGAQGNRSEMQMGYAESAQNEMRRGGRRNEMAYNEGGSSNEMRRGGRGNRNEMGGEGYFVWDGETPQHMPPDRYGRPSNQDRSEEMTNRYYSPYGDQPDVYKRQESNRYAESRRSMEGRNNIVDLDTFSHKTDPLNQKDGKEHYEKPRQIGFQQQKHGDDQGMDKQMAMEWVENMEDGEGVRGGKYTWHQTQQYAMNKGITGEKRLVEFYVAMNAMYSDYSEAAKKFGVDKPEFYACLAKLFIEDPDAVDNKMEEYYKHVVKHHK